jgi:HlyD family secretion protein
VALVIVVGGAGWVIRGDDLTATDVLVSGTVEARETDLGFQLSGRILRLAVREGDRVLEGDLLAVLDLAEVEGRRAAAAARADAVRARLDELLTGSRVEEIDQARAAVRSATDRAADARREADRAIRLHDGGAVSRQWMERTILAREVADAGLEQAEAQLAIVTTGPRPQQLDAQRALLREAEAVRTQMDAALENGRIIAPFDGLVTIRHREPGETVPAGAPVLTLRHLDDRWVRVYVHENDVAAIALGQAATVLTDTWPGRTFAGEIVFIGTEAEFTPRNVQTEQERSRLVYPVRVRITDDAERALKPGLPADVRFALRMAGGG